MQRPVLLLVALAFAGCGREHRALVAPEPPGEAVGRPFPEQIVTSVGVTPQSFRPGETARIDVSVSNHGSQPITLCFSNGCVLAFQVRDSKGELVAPLGIVCTMDAPTMHLEAGESRTAWFFWKGDRYDLQTGEERLLPPGTYEVRGGLDAFHFDRPSEPVTVGLLAP